MGDREIHREEEQKDGIRTSILEAKGIDVIRFSNRDVLYRIDSVVDKLYQKCI